MTRTLCSRSSKRKKVQSSQEVIPYDLKENSPSVLSQTTTQKFKAKDKCSNVSKENVPPTPSMLPNLTTVNTNEFYSPVRKSTRRLKLPLTNNNKQLKRNVLCDKTNSPRLRGNKLKEQSSDIIKTIENQTNILHKLITVPKPNLGSVGVGICPLKDRSNNENHVPVYKTVGSLKLPSGSEIPPPEEKEAVYEFEVDENEEPVKKKKRTKRAYIRKPKMGPKALTINNIKYSSTESLVSLPEKPVSQQKRTSKKSKPKLKPNSSLTILNDSEDTCSVKSFMSHPPSLMLCENKGLKSKHKLSVLQETLSEQCQSPTHHTNIDLHPDLPKYHSSSSYSASAHAVTKIGDPSTSAWHDVHFSPNPRCYVSKTSHTSDPNIELQGSLYQNTGNDTLLHRVSPFSPNISTASPHDFLSSTPCKKVSLVVCNNSVFDNTSDLPRGLRPSTGFMKDVSVEAFINEDNCFGFDEPLVSPIKCSIDLEPIKPVRRLAWESEHNDVANPKPSAQEVIKMLKATLPKATYKESSKVFDTSSNSDNSSSPSIIEKVTEVHFKKPPRRSYERQRRIRHNSEHEEEENSDEEDEIEAPRENKKCYKKINTTKIEKPPKITKAKQRIAKEEEEMERLVSQMNAQFQEIDKVNLVVE